MKGLIEEIEDFQAEIKKDLGVDEDILTDQAMLDSLKDWEHLFRIKEECSEDSTKGNAKGNLESFKDSMEKIDTRNLENERNNLVEKLRKVHYQNEMNS